MSYDSVQSSAATVRSALVLLVHSNLLISLSAMAVAVSTIILADLPLDPVPLFIVFAAALFVYSFNRLTDLAEDEQNDPGRASVVKQYGKILFVTGGFLYALATGVAVVTGIPGAPAMIVPLAVAVLYSVLGAKRILLVKNLLVGLSWGMIPLGVGVYYEQLLTVDVLFMFGFITAALTVAAVVFDIKDTDGDRAEGIQTVPLVFGVGRTRRGAAVASGLLGLLITGSVSAGIVDRQYLLLVPFTAYMIGYSLAARGERTTLFYGFVIDSEHIYLAVALLCTDLLT
jgi:4-hydroxybenzoate polyprenyltransferase